MIESLLYPKKLTEPPQLLVDVESLFHKGNLMDTNLVCFAYFSPNNKVVNYRLIGVGTDGPDTFRVSFVADVTGMSSTDYVMATIAVPFQNLRTETMSVKCHGWSTAGAAIMGTPDKTVEKSPASMVNPPEVRRYAMGMPDGHEYLFKMEGSELEGGKKFSSWKSGTNIYFGYINSSGDIGTEFPEIFGHYATVALEVIVKVTVYSGTSPYGFQVGIV